jgi:hypothetical protein
MSSKSIYPHVPYFYVIEHVASGKKYAGCRYAKGCNPAEFMTEDGYCTSSNVVKKIIEEEGRESFKIVEIKTIDEVGNVLSYETKFLVENDCAKSDLWLNQHNNTGMTFGSEEFKATMRAKHGVEHSMQSEECKGKQRKTCLKNRGVEYPMQSEECKGKQRKTCLKNRGVEYPMQSEEVQEKSRQTCIDRYGYEHASQSEEVQEKSRQTMLKKRGVEHPMQSEEVREKHRQAMLAKHGVENYGQTKEHRERITNLNFERFDFRINNEILNGDFSRFVYLYDAVENVFLMGIEKSLNRGLETKRYIKIGSNRSGSKKHVDVLSGKLI